MWNLSDVLSRAERGRICYHSTDRQEPDAGTWSITIPLEPFSADDWTDPTSFRPGQGGPELVSTAIRLDFILLPCDNLTDLGGKVFEFPVNPAEGYIDGSIYLGGAHNPVDVTRIEFGQQTGHSIEAVVHTNFDFRHENVPIQNQTALLRVTLTQSSLDRDTTDNG